MHTQLAEGVYCVGVTDWGLRHFHGHELSTHRGSSYNAYLILGKKNVLIDTVWGPFQEQLLANLRELIDPAKIDIVVANHAETDHSGALPLIMRQTPDAQVVVSKRGLESIPGHYHKAWNFKPVQTGDKIDLGGPELIFVEAPMLHWPDSMFTYLTGRNILFPNDAFGQHYATSFRFNDEVDREELFQEALKYYANILTPFSDRVGKKIEELLALNLPVDMIAPSHGIIWRQDPLQIVMQYQAWAAQTPEPTAVILYDTMWEATRRMADAIGDGLGRENVSYKIFHMAVSDRNDVLAEVFKTKAIVVGSPALNNGVLPTLTPILEDLRGLRFKNKIGAAFGSYGWSGENVKLIEEHFNKCKIPVAVPGVRAKWQPTPEDLAACEKMGRELAVRIKTP